jgi:sugar phosphate isomerase/epimerase
MLLSFTTLGCPGWDLDTVISRAASYGFDAVDFRGLGEEMEIWRLPEFSTNAADTAKRIADAGLAVSCLSSSVQVANPDRAAANRDEVASYGQLCETFGTRHIRVFGGKIGDTDRQEAIERTAVHLAELAAIAERHGTKLLIETHDDWTSREHVAAVLTAAGDVAAGVLWDVHHPWRTIDEQPEDTLATLGKWIENSHWKDSSGTREAFTYVAMGEGDLPLEKMASLLRESGYSGYHTFEWEKRWHQELAEPEVAFPQYVAYMRGLTTSS